MASSAIYQAVMLTLLTFSFRIIQKTRLFTKYFFNVNFMLKNI